MSRDRIFLDRPAPILAALARVLERHPAREGRAHPNMLIRTGEQELEVVVRYGVGVSDYMTYFVALDDGAVSVEGLFTEAFISLEDYDRLTAQGAA